MAALVTEGVGTMLLVLTILLAVLGEAPVPVAAAVGVVLLAIVYAGGPVSRAMYNPAVTVGFRLRGVDLVGGPLANVVAQVAGTAVAVGLGVALIGPSTAAPRDVDLLPALVAEVVFTFALMWVILHVADLRPAQGNAWYGVAIAGIVATAILVVGPVSGAVLNPAVGLALGVHGLLGWADVLAYVPAQVAGAALAALVARTTAEPVTPR